MPASRWNFSSPNTFKARWQRCRTAGPERSSCAASNSASDAMSASVYRRRKLGCRAGFLSIRRVSIQRRISRVSWARLKAVTLARKRLTIPLAPCSAGDTAAPSVPARSARRPTWFHGRPAHVPTRLHELLHLGERQPLQIAHANCHSSAASYSLVFRLIPRWNRNPRFRLIPHWNRTLRSGSSRIGQFSVLQSSTMTPYTRVSK